MNNIYFYKLTADNGGAPGDAPDFVEVGEAGIAVDEGYAASAFCSTRWVTYLD